MQHLFRFGLLLGVGSMLVSLACGGGGGRGVDPPPPPPVCQDQGITVTTIFRPGNSNCNTSNSLLARVSNQSCDPLTINGFTLSTIDPGNSCGDLPDLEDVPVDPITIASKEAETVELGDITWCCTCQTSFECTWQAQVTLDTDQGDLLGDPSTSFTKSFGPFCQDCSTSASQLGGPAGSAPAECRVGVRSAGPLSR